MKSEELKRIVNAIPDGKEVIFEYSLFYFNGIHRAHSIKDEKEYLMEDYEPDEELLEETECELESIAHLNEDDYIIGFGN